jgi:hypothetical protein
MPNTSRDRPTPAALTPVIARGRRAASETPKDLAWLRWLGRFRFVTAELMALRFGVTVQNARRRLALMIAAKVVTAHASGFGMPRLFVLADAGALLVGYPPRRRPPRPELHQVHELAIVELVASLELSAHASARVLTERDCRRRTATGPVRYSVRVRSDRGEQNRWPDVAVIANAARIAVEIELAPKHTARLAQIVRGYLLSNDYDEVRFLVASPSLARRLSAIALDQRARLGLDHADDSTRVVIDAWSHASPTERDAIRAAST